MGDSKFSIGAGHPWHLLTPNPLMKVTSGKFGLKGVPLRGLVGLGSFEEPSVGYSKVETGDSPSICFASSNLSAISTFSDPSFLLPLCLFFFPLHLWESYLFGMKSCGFVNSCNVESILLLRDSMSAIPLAAAICVL